MKILYYIASIGGPDLEVKIDILIHNIKYIYNNINNKFDIMINCYEEDDMIIQNILNNIKQINIINEFFIYKKKGVLTELFLTNPHNNILPNYDYILFILDDVKIINLNIPHMIELKKLHNIEIVSPKIIKSSHWFMNVYDNITINNFVEVYLLLLKPDELNKFFSLHTLENKWMWGVDLLFGYYNIRAGVINNYSAEHVLQSNSDKGEANHLMTNYFKQKTSYNSIDEVWDIYQAIRQHITI
jgi:hypothetical protein